MIDMETLTSWPAVHSSGGAGSRSRMSRPRAMSAGHPPANTPHGEATGAVPGAHQGANEPEAHGKSGGSLLPHDTPMVRCARSQFVAAPGATVFWVYHSHECREHLPAEVSFARWTARDTGRSNVPCAHAPVGASVSTTIAARRFMGAAAPGRGCVLEPKLVTKAPFLGKVCFLLHTYINTAHACTFLRNTRYL